MKYSILLVWTSGHLDVYFLQFLLASPDPSTNVRYVEYIIVFIYSGMLYLFASYS